MLCSDPLTQAQPEQPAGSPAMAQHTNTQPLGVLTGGKENVVATPVPSTEPKQNNGYVASKNVIPPRTSSDFDVAELLMSMRHSVPSPPLAPPPRPARYFYGTMAGPIHSKVPHTPASYPYPTHLTRPHPFLSMNLGKENNPPYPATLGGTPNPHGLESAHPRLVRRLHSLLHPNTPAPPQASYNLPRRLTWSPATTGNNSSGENINVNNNNSNNNNNNNGHVAMIPYTPGPVQQNENTNTNTLTRQPSFVVTPSADTHPHTHPTTPGSNISSGSFYVPTTQDQNSQFSPNFPGSNNSPLPSGHGHTPLHPQSMPPPSQQQSVFKAPLPYTHMPPAGGAVHENPPTVQFSGEQQWGGYGYQYAYQHYSGQPVLNHGIYVYTPSNDVSGITQNSGSNGVQVNEQKEGRGEVTMERKEKEGIAE